MRIAITVAAALLAVAALVVVGESGSGRVRQSEPRLIGLVELPGLFGVRDPDGPPGALLPGDRTVVMVRAEPAEAAAVIGNVSAADSIEWREADYEAPAAVAFGVRDGWVRVAIGGTGGRRYGWVSPEQLGALHKHGDLVAGGLAYLTGAWDGVLREAPSTAAAPSRGGAAPEGSDVDVVEVLQVGGVTWLEVERLAPGRCQEPTTTVVSTGWVPALAETGLPNVWFHARGC